MQSKPKFTSIDEYIAAFPADIQEKLQLVRATIKAAAPQAQEKIAYAMPTFTLKGNLVHFAALKRHIGFYPASSGMREFEAELRPYRSTPGAANFPLDEPLPLELIGRIVKFRAAENLRKAEEKARRRE